jgi:tripartite-type tricarboxylate transporter receptor subunit TctC
MRLLRLITCLFSFGPLAMSADIAVGQDYPSKPIRMLVSEPGGAGDLAARLVAPPLTLSFGQQIIIDNRPGAFTSGRLAANASPDGYTLLFVASNLWLQPFMRSNVPFDPVKDFSPVTLMTTSPLIVVVHPSVAANSVKELIALIKAKPGVLNYGSGNTGSSSHLGPELLKSMTGLNIVRVPYKGAGPALNALVAAEVQLMVASAGSSMQHVKSNRLRALAVTSAQPSALLPGLPTVAESGVPGYEFAQTLGVLAPAKTPASIINRLNQEIVRAISQADIKQKFFSAGVEPVGSTPTVFGALIKSDMVRLGKVIRDAGIREE